MLRSKKTLAYLTVATVSIATVAVPQPQVFAKDGTYELVQGGGSWTNPQHIFDNNRKDFTNITASKTVVAQTLQKAANATQLKQVMANAINAFDTTVKIEYTGNISTVEKDISAIFNSFDSTFETMYAVGTLDRLKYSYTGTASKLTITMSISYHTDKAKETYVTNEVKRITSKIISSNMTDVEKVKAVNDFVVKNTTYSTNTTASAHSVYAVLTEKKGVCQGYALLAYRLLKEAGLNAYYVTGIAGGGAHAWNLVQVGGKWYHLDTTWNDPTFTESSNQSDNHIQYKYFLVPDSIIKADHIMDNKGYPKATDDKFAVFRSIVDPVQVGNVLYFPNAKANEQLYKFDLSQIGQGLQRVSTTRVQNLTYANGWLYFSNYSHNGYLSKMKLDGTQLSIVDMKVVKEITLEGNNLIYKDTFNRSYTLPVVDLQQLNQQAANSVISLINKINSSATNFKDQVAQARAAFDALTAEQQALITNVTVLTNAESYILSNQSPVPALPNSSTATANVSIEEIRDALKPFQLNVTNNISVTFPTTALPTQNGSVGVTINRNANNIQFNVTVNNERATFNSYIDVAIGDIPTGAVVLRLDKNNELAAVPFTIRDATYVVKAMSSENFVVSTEDVTFDDITKDGHRAFIEELAKRRIVKGVTDEAFNPNTGITRAQFAVMISRALNLKASEATQFTDVKGKWYEAEVQALVKVGIINGKSPQIFDPSQTLTRQQASLMIVRLLEFAGVELPKVDLAAIPFTDFDKVPDNAKQQVAIAYKLGIFSGKDGGKFDPSGKLTRSQMTKVLYKALELAEMM